MTEKKTLLQMIYRLKTKIQNLKKESEKTTFGDYVSIRWRANVNRQMSNQLIAIGKNQLIAIGKEGSPFITQCPLAFSLGLYNCTAYMQVPNS